jgi:hypothetical protein
MIKPPGAHWAKDAANMVNGPLIFVPKVDALVTNGRTFLMPDHRFSGIEALPPPPDRHFVSSAVASVVNQSTKTHSARLAPFVNLKNE